MTVKIQNIHNAVCEISYISCAVWHIGILINYVHRFSCSDDVLTIGRNMYSDIFYIADAIPSVTLLLWPTVFTFHSHPVLVLAVENFPCLIQYHQITYKRAIVFGIRQFLSFYLHQPLCLSLSYISSPSEPICTDLAVRKCRMTSYDADACISWFIR